MKITTERILEALQEDDNSGFCTACGADASGVEPDADNYVCEECGKPCVHGAEQLLLMS